jgi:hypothetical protein
MVMPAAAGDGEPGLDRFRDYLVLLARVQMDARLRAQLNPSDIVQQTLLEAYRQREQFRGQDDAALAGWLRQILAHNLADAGRALGRARRDVARERSLEAVLEESSVRLHGALAADQSSPSQHAMIDSANTAQPSPARISCKPNTPVAHPRPYWGDSRSRSCRRATTPSEQWSTTASAKRTWPAASYSAAGTR